MIIVWLHLCSNTKPPTPSISLIIIDGNPTLRFPHLDVLYKSLSNASNHSVTPAATPLASTFSPDQSGFVSTPGGPVVPTSAPTPTSSAFEDNVEARLIDAIDETWGVTMARDFQHPDMSLASVHASASGYLIKRAGARDDDGFKALAVSIIHAAKPDKALLREVLGMYRGLALLARVRGVVDPVNNMLPWHVAATRKAQAIFSDTMRWTVQSPKTGS